METFIIDVPVPSMGATVIELNVIALRVKTGERVSKGQRIAELESDKSTFEFESPCEGVMKMIDAIDGQTLQSGHLFCQIETSDESQRHLMTQGRGANQPTVMRDQPKVAAIWTPRAIKLAQEAGLDPAGVSDIEATGPGGRVSGDDVLSYLAKRKS